MNEKLMIPQKIKVGFQNRTDTYTGKLAGLMSEDAKTSQALKELEGLI